MLNRLIRWLARAELCEARVDAEIRTTKELSAHYRTSALDYAELRAELEQIKATSDQAINLAYANGFNAGRAIGHGEMLAHLRGDPDERVTTEIMQRRAVEMVH